MSKIHFKAGFINKSLRIDYKKDLTNNKIIS